MNQRTLSKVFIWGFLFLYLLVAGISFCHAVQFFNIGNVLWMAATLAFSFELGLALSLAAILLSDDNKKNKLPWILMIVLTFVQVVGNVYSTFKYISLSDVDYYIYLQKPLLFWIEEISQETVQVIISWIIGAILPIVALFMTDMVASNIKIVYSHKEEDDKKLDDLEDKLIGEPAGQEVDAKEIQEQMNEADAAEDNTPAEEPIAEEKKEEPTVEKHVETPKEEPVIVEDVKEELPTEPVINEVKEEVKTEPEVKEVNLEAVKDDVDKQQIEQAEIIPESISNVDDSSLKEINDDIEYDEKDIPAFEVKDDVVNEPVSESIEEKPVVQEQQEQPKPQTYVQSAPRINRNTPNELITTSVKTI